MKELLVVDCQYDFINGTLACGNSDNAVKNIIAFINANPDAKIYYSADYHDIKHCSYKQNGGIWVVHCQAGTHGAEIHEDFYSKIINPEQRPNSKNIFYKGTDISREEYSAFDAKNKSGEILNQVLGNEVIVCGIASEFCVRESVLALLNSGRKVELLKECVAWVDENNHVKNLSELEKLGVKIS